jgi:glutathione S-transferase
MASLQQLNGYTYHWKEQDRDQDQQIGLLAQEVQKVYPQLVKQTSEGYLSINYNGMIPVLLEALKEQCEILKEQQKQIDELKQRLH